MISPRVTAMAIAAAVGVLGNIVSPLLAGLGFVLASICLVWAVKAGDLRKAPGTEQMSQQGRRIYAGTAVFIALIWAVLGLSLALG